MDIIREIIFGFVFLFLVILSAEVIVSKSKKVAKSIGISEFFIGLTILSIGTSLAELATHVAGSVEILQGADINAVSSIVLGTNIGSNLIQITFITGIVGLFGIIHTKKHFLKNSYMVMLGSIVLLFLIGLVTL